MSVVRTEEWGGGAKGGEGGGGGWRSRRVCQVAGGWRPLGGREIDVVGSQTW